MERIELVFLKSELHDIIPFLQERGVVHIEDVPLALEDHPGFLHRIHLPEPERRERERFERLQSALRETVTLLDAKPGESDIRSAGRKLEDESDVAAWDEEIRSTLHALRSLTRRRLNGQDNLDMLASYRRVLATLAPLIEDRDVRLGETAHALLIPSDNAEELEAIAKRIVRDVGPECNLISHAMDRRNLVAVVTHPKQHAGPIGDILREHGIIPLDVPDPDLTGISVAEAVRRAQSKVHRFEKDIAAIEAERKSFAEVHAARIHALTRAIGDRYSRLSVVEHLAQSEMIAVLHGWVPKEVCENLEADLRKTFGARAVLGRLSRKDVDIHRVPTLLKNHPIFRPFQLILAMFDPPKYGSFDPTWLVAVSFILFYGFILGDAGYGLFIIGVGAFVKRKVPFNAFVQDAMTIAQWMGISSIVWGIVYGEFFGDLPYRLFGLHGPFHRADPNLYMALLAFAIAYGIIHIPLGLILGVWEGYRHGHHHHAEEKLGMLLGLTAVGLAVAGIMGVLPYTPALAAGAVVFLVGVFFLVKSMGAMFAMGIMEILGLTSNVLSYGRLMALGLASVVLADLANVMLNMEGAKLFLVGIPAAGVIHLLNIGIGVFSPTIHSLRLNYVEFLPKFYEPEGRNYEPFRKELTW
jgi:V/A-type H+-transporting ATPase subunit I